MTIFKACDIRGVYGRDLTERDMDRVGQAIGTMAVIGTMAGIGTMAAGTDAHGHSVILAGDVRESTASLKASVAAGLVSTGAEVVDIGIVPTPAFNFAVDWLGPAAGAMVTASHNPPEFNGLKFVIRGQVTGPELVSEVEATTSSGAFRRGCGSVATRDILPDYEDFILRTADRWPAHSRRIRLVVDAGNGCYWDVAPRLLRRLGFDVTPLFCEQDGRFPNRDPNPAAAGSLKVLQQEVVRTAAHVGVAFDGDGDRAVFVDHAGSVVASEHAACLLATDILRDNPGGKVVYDLKSTRALAEHIESQGGEPLMERSGYSFIKRRMREEHAVLGAEASGHFFYGFMNGRDDGLLTAAYVASIVAGSERSLKEMVDALPRYAITPDVRVPWDPDDIPDTIAAIREGADGQVSDLDGVRIEYEDGWGLVRASVTEPLVTLRFEARSDQQLGVTVRRFLAPVPDLAREVAAKLGWDERTPPIDKPHPGP